MGSIYYLIPDIRPDLSARGFFRSLKKGDLKRHINKRILSQKKAIGGVKVMYQHLLMLQKHDISAFPVLMGSYQGNFFGYDLKFKIFKEVCDQVTKNDIVVSTEVRPYDGLKFPEAIKVMFLQNWISIDRYFDPGDEDKSYLDLGYDHVITCSEYCTRVVREKMGIDSRIITNGIDQTKFVPEPSKRIPGRVLALSRKRYQDFERIRDICKPGIDYKVVDGLTQAELIEEYVKADIFLATGYPEGFSLPPLEAMSCGCAVVGFTGQGAREFMIDGETALVAQDGDCETAAEKLQLLLQDRELKERIRAQGQAKAGHYTLERTENLVLDFFRSIQPS